MVETDETRREQLVEYLMEEGPLSGDEMQGHLLRADQSERSLVDILYDEAETPETAEALAQSMAALFDAEVVDVTELDGHPATMTILPESLAREKGVLGCADPEREDRLALVVYDPVTVDALVKTVTSAAGAPPRIFLAPRDPLLEVIEDFYDAYDPAAVEDGESLPVASVLSGVRPLDLAFSLDDEASGDGQTESEAAAREDRSGADAGALRDETTRPDDSAEAEGDSDLSEDSFGDDLERAVSDSLDDLDDVFDESEAETSEEDDWLSETDDEDWLSESDELAVDADESGADSEDDGGGSGIRYPGSADGASEESGGESTAGQTPRRPEVGAERRGSTPFGEIVEPSAGLDEDTATGSPDIEQTGEMVPDDSEPVIDTSPQGDGPQVDDAFADAWPEDEASEAESVGQEPRESQRTDGESRDVESREGAAAASEGSSVESSLESVIDVSSELSGASPEQLDPEMSQSSSRQTLIDMVEKHGRMLKRLNSKISYQKRIIEELSRLLVDGRVIAREELYDRLKRIRREFTKDGEDGE